MDTIRTDGVLEPIIVRQLDDGTLQILAGHNRCAGARQAGLEVVPGKILKGVDDETAERIVHTTNLVQRSLADMKLSEKARVVSLSYKGFFSPGKRTDKRDGMQHSIRFNPLHHIRDGVDIREQVDMLFAAAGVTSGGEFWVRLAKQLLMTLIEYVRSVFAEPTYGDVYDFLVQYGVEDMRSMFSGLPESHPARSYWGPISGSDDKILASAITELGTVLSIFAQHEVKTLTACSDISPDVPGKEKAAIFIICDSENSTYDILTTMFLSTCFREVIRHQDDVIADGGELRRVRFILDELANIAGIKDIERKLNTCRSRKVSAIAACQTMSQIRSIVGDPIKESDLIGAFGYFITLGSSDLETMRYFSEMAGESTVVDTAHESSGAVRYTYTSRKLITPDEIRRIPQDQLILFRSGFQPIRLKKLNYKDFITDELSRTDYRCRAKHPLITGGWDANGKEAPDGFSKHKPNF